MKAPYRLLRRATERQRKDPVGLVAYVSDFLSPEECLRARQHGDAAEVHEGRTGAEGKQDEARDSTVRFVYPAPSNEWLFARIEGAVLRLNAGYDFELQGFYEGMQIASYRPGGHYDWHMDLGTETFSARKLSVSVQLSEAADYSGGELEFMATQELAPRELGSLIVFPSFLIHRVRPVTAGERWSLVSWISGPPFR